MPKSIQPLMENHMMKKREDEMETRCMQGLYIAQAQIITNILVPDSVYSDDGTGYL